MKKILIGAGIVFTLLIAAVIALPFLVPASTYRDVIETQLETALGRDVVFEKDPRIRFFPELGVGIEGVTIANAEGFDAPHFAKADSMNVAVKWLPLFSRRVEIASASFIGTEVLLQEKANGTANWVFEPANQPEKTPDTPDTSSQQDPGFDALIPKASLKDSRISFISAASKLSYDVTDINLDASLSGLEGPVSVKGVLTVNQEPFQVSALLTSLSDIMNGTPFTAEADIRSALADLTYSGSVTTGEPISLDGTFSAKVGNLTRALAFASISTEQSLDEIGSVSVDGKLSGTTERLSVTDLTVRQQGKNLTTGFIGQVSLAGTDIRPDGILTINSGNVKALASGFGVELEGTDSKAYRTLAAELALKPAQAGTLVTIKSFQFDEVAISGIASFDLAPKVPKFTADLTVPLLDATPYLVETSDGGKAGDPSDGWSTDPIDLSALTAANGAVKVSIGKLSNAQAEILDVQLDARLENGRLTGVLTSVAPESGRTTNSAKLNPLRDGSLTTNFVLSHVRENQNRLSFSTKGSGIAAADLVKFFTGQNVLQGIAGIEASVETNGASVADFVKNLSGSYKAEVSDGAVLGINLAQLLRSAQDAILTGKLPSALSPEQQTDFSSLSLAGDMTDGKARIETFRLLSPLLQADATGTVDVFNQTLDIRINPKALASADSSLSGIYGFGIPLRVSGSWSKVSGSLDMDYLQKLVAEQARLKVTEELQGNTGKKLNDFLNKALGRTDSKEETPETETEDSDTEAKEDKKSDTEKARDLLKGLFGN